MGHKRFIITVFQGIDKEVAENLYHLNLWSLHIFSNSGQLDHYVYYSFPSTHLLQFVATHLLFCFLALYFPSLPYELAVPWKQRPSVGAFAPPAPRTVSSTVSFLIVHLYYLFHVFLCISFVYIIYLLKRFLIKGYWKHGINGCIKLFWSPKANARDLNIIRIGIFLKKKKNQSLKECLYEMLIAPGNLGTREKCVHLYEN